MKLCIVLAGGLAFLLHALTFVDCNVPRTAQEMLTQNLCICPCGNPKGGKLYQVSYDVVENWYDAVAHCNALGMSIASIEDASQHVQLQQYLFTHRYNRNVQYWIGANNLVSGRKLRWGLTDREVHNANWVGAREPRFGPSHALCATINGYSMLWSGSDCEAKSRQVICEY
ncbi:uncharacterized protein LOC131267646 [Anopheles coustani]|uniref:uncharacterized protein LOC131267646 n=2 Tax=coustani group TaxID=59130 RepID=UPI002659D773|nr:uncharacterized protein LOC131267646 [Anopheles coustani]